MPLKSSCNIWNVTETLLKCPLNIHWNPVEPSPPPFRLPWNSWKLLWPHLKSSEAKPVVQAPFIFIKRRPSVLWIGQWIKEILELKKKWQKRKNLNKLIEPRRKLNKFSLLDYALNANFLGSFQKGLKIKLIKNHVSRFTPAGLTGVNLLSKLARYFTAIQSVRWTAHVLNSPKWNCCTPSYTWVKIDILPELSRNEGAAAEHQQQHSFYF